MKQCRMCEWEFTFQDKIPVDGLCATCHMNLCQDGLGKCIRCAMLMDRMMNFLYPGENEDE